MKKKVGMAGLIISFIPYAFILFCCFYTAIAGLDYFGTRAIGLSGFGTAFTVWTDTFWRVGIIPVCLAYQLLYFSKDKSYAGAMRFAVIFIGCLYIATVLFF